MSLITVCVAAFCAVFALLIVLALVIRLLTVAFPLGAQADEAAMVAAISAAVTNTYPGVRVTRIEEKP
jgi:hypothetical protein